MDLEFEINWFIGCRYVKLDTLQIEFCINPSLFVWNIVSWQLRSKMTPDLWPPYAQKTSTELVCYPGLAFNGSLIPRVYKLNLFLIHQYLPKCMLRNQSKRSYISCRNLGKNRLPVYHSISFMRSDLRFHSQPWYNYCTTDPVQISYSQPWNSYCITEPD